MNHPSIHPSIYSHQHRPFLYCHDSLSLLLSKYYYYCSTKSIVDEQSQSHLQYPSSHYYSTPRTNSIVHIHYHTFHPHIPARFPPEPNRFVHRHCYYYYFRHCSTSSCRVPIALLDWHPIPGVIHRVVPHRVIFRFHRNSIPRRSIRSLLVLDKRVERWSGNGVRRRRIDVAWGWICIVRDW